MQHQADREQWIFRQADRDEWDRCWRTLPFTNLPQSWEYGNARTRSGWRAKRFILEDGLGNNLGVAQFIVWSLPLLGGAARLNRGPILLDDPVKSGGQGLLKPVIDALSALARSQHWRLLRVAPEWPAGVVAEGLLGSSRFKAAAGPAWGSVRVPLDRSDDELMASFNGKWRNLLRKSLRMDQRVVSPSDGTWLPDLLPRYRELQRRNGFAGVPEYVLRGLEQQGLLQAFTAYPGNALGQDALDPAGVVVAASHGNTATYLLGWTSAEGRKLQSNYRLLWKAMLAARDAGLAWFDMGGLTADTPAGIAHFKRGVGGEQYELVGEWSLKRFGFP